MQLARHIASPAVVAGNAVRVSGLHRGEQVRTERIAAVMCFAEPFHGVALRLDASCFSAGSHPQLVSYDERGRDADRHGRGDDPHASQRRRVHLSGHLASSLDQGV